MTASSGEMARSNAARTAAATRRPSSCSRSPCSIRIASVPRPRVATPMPPTGRPAGRQPPVPGAEARSLDETARAALATTRANAPHPPRPTSAAPTPAPDTPLSEQSWHVPQRLHLAAKQLGIGGIPVAPHHVEEVGDQDKVPHRQQRASEGNDPRLCAAGQLGQADDDEGKQVQEPAHTEG